MDKYFTGLIIILNQRRQSVLMLRETGPAPVGGALLRGSGGQVDRGREAVNVTPDRKGTWTGLLLYLLIVIKINFAFWYHNSSCTSSNLISVACCA